MKTILIFEPLSGGHRANYIGWLTGLINQNPPAGYRFVFFTAENLSAAEIRRLASAGRWGKQQILYSLFRAACRKYRPDHALILELTRLELPLALFGSPVPLSAILFVQYPEISKGWKKTAKHWKTRLLLRRASVKNLFLLNGEHSCDWLNERFSSGTRFIPIPDPAPEGGAEAGFNLRDTFKISPDRKIFLFFGAISPRKGAGELIQALHLLSPEAAAKSAFIFCGEPEQNYRKTFEQAIERLRAARHDITLNIEARFVSDQRMMALFEQSDVVLMPYTRPDYSSGILALAAKARTPVIGPEAGLLGRLIRENGLGVTCPADPESLADCIGASVQKLPAVDNDLCGSFAQKSRPDVFARIIMTAVTESV